MALTNKHIQLFRNEAPATSKAEAIQKLDELATQKKINDGVPVLASYKEGEAVKTLLALFRVVDDKTSYTLLTDGSAGSVAELELNELKAKLGDGFTATDTVAKVIEKLKGGSTKTIKELEDKVTNLTLETVTGEGEVIASVAQTGGLVSATKLPLKDVKLKGYTKGTEEGALVDGDTLVQALTKLENNATKSNVTIKANEKVLEKDEHNALFTNITLKKVEASSSAVKEEYTIVGKDDTDLAVGNHIKIYKDSALKSISLVDENAEHTAGQFLKYVYVDLNGDEQTTYVDCSKFLIDSEFKHGLTVNTAGEVSIKIDTTGENFLSVGENGVKISGVTKAIEDVKKAATTVVSAATDQHISVEESEGANGNKVFTLSDNVAGNNVKMKGFTADTKGLTGITEDKTVSEAIKVIETEMLSNEEVVAAALNDLKTTKIDKITINNSEVTISSTEDHIRTAEINITTDGLKLRNYYGTSEEDLTIKENDSLNVAIAKLYKAISGKTGGVKAGDGIKLDTVDTSKVIVNAATETTENNIAKFDFEDGKLVINSIDAGTY